MGVRCRQTGETNIRLMRLWRLIARTSLTFAKRPLPDEFRFRSRTWKGVIKWDLRRYLIAQDSEVIAVIWIVRAVVAPFANSVPFPAAVMTAAKTSVSGWISKSEL